MTDPNTSATERLAQINRDRIAAEGERFHAGNRTAVHGTAPTRATPAEERQRQAEQAATAWRQVHARIEDWPADLAAAEITRTEQTWGADPTTRESATSRLSSLVTLTPPSTMGEDVDPATAALVGRMRGTSA